MIATTLLSAVIGAGIFAAAAYLGIELSRIVYARREPPATQEAGFKIILGVSAVGGACLATRGLTWEDLSMAAILCTALAACCHGAITTGKISDYFVLVPLSAIVISDLAQENWFLLLSPLVPFVPFAVAAHMSRGKAMGWDDAKLAALGGAVLGPWFALLAFATACIAATVIAWSRKKTREPMLLAPYMTGAIALCLLLTMSRGS